MHRLLYFLLILFVACNPQTTEEEAIENDILGNWSFLDGRGNYTEAFFGDSTYITFNLVKGASPVFSYVVKNDSLYSNIDKRKTGLNRIAAFNWLNKDNVILVTEFSRDTLERISDPENTLQHIDLKSDSAVYLDAIKKRYEDFLVRKGILSQEEIDQYKNDSIVPEDVIESLKQ